MKKDFEISELNDIYGVLLTPHQCDILRSYYDYDLSLAEIAENSGVSRQAVRDAIVKASEQLAVFEAKLGFRRIKRQLAEASELLKNGFTDKAAEIIDKLL